MILKDLRIHRPIADKNKIVRLGLMEYYADFTNTSLLTTLCRHLCPDYNSYFSISGVVL